MTWKDAVEELDQRKELAYRMSGEENVEMNPGTPYLFLDIVRVHDNSDIIRGTQY